MNIFGNNNSSSDLAEFKDPFNKDSVEKIFFVVRRDLWKPAIIQYCATVYFKNGNTKGEQEIEAGSFVELVEKTELFVKSL